jgi:hypothetical protein
MRTYIECPACRSMEVTTISRQAIVSRRFVDYVLFCRCNNCQYEFKLGEQTKEQEERRSLCR